MLSLAPDYYALAEGLGFRVSGLGFRVKGLRFGVQGSFVGVWWAGSSGGRVVGSGILHYPKTLSCGSAHDPVIGGDSYGVSVWGLGFRVWGLGFRVWV